MKEGRKTLKTVANWLYSLKPPKSSYKNHTSYGG